MAPDAKYRLMSGSSIGRDKLHRLARNLLAEFLMILPGSFDDSAHARPEMPAGRPCDDGDDVTAVRQHIKHREPCLAVKVSHPRHGAIKSKQVRPGSLLAPSER